MPRKRQIKSAKQKQRFNRNSVKKSRKNVRKSRMSGGILGRGRDFVIPKDSNDAFKVIDNLNIRSDIKKLFLANGKYHGIYGNEERHIEILQKNITKIADYNNATSFMLNRTPQYLQLFLTYLTEFVPDDNIIKVIENKTLQKAKEKYKAEKEITKKTEKEKKTQKYLEERKAVYFEEITKCINDDLEEDFFNERLDTLMTGINEHTTFYELKKEQNYQPQNLKFSVDDVPVPPEGLFKGFIDKLSKTVTPVTTAKGENQTQKAEEKKTDKVEFDINPKDALEIINFLDESYIRHLPERGDIKKEHIKNLEIDENNYTPLWIGDVRVKTWFTVFKRVFKTYIVFVILKKLNLKKNMRYKVIFTWSFDSDRTLFRQILKIIIEADTTANR